MNVVYCIKNQKVNGAALVEGIEKDKYRIFMYL